MGGIRVRDHRVGRSGSDWNRVGVEVDFWVSYGRRRVLDVYAARLGGFSLTKDGCAYA